LTDDLILVTGATGYIASRLIPRLLERGDTVRALARKPRRLAARKWSQQVEVMQGDVLDPSGLPAALAGVHSAYYLIHNMSLGRGYIPRELEGARTFGERAQKAGVRHIIYLGGLANPHAHIAAHLRSRIETGEVLRRSGVPITELRAGAIIGAGSISFEMIRFISEQFPILPGPRWLRNRTQPIAIENVLDYLLAARDHPQGGIYEIGGPEVMTYAETMRRYAHLRGLRRWMFLVPALPVWFMAWWVQRLTPVPFPIAYALVEGLRADSVVQDDSARRKFPGVELLPYQQAMSKALAALHPDQVERVWDADRRAATLRHEGFFIDHRRQLVGAGPAAVLRALTPPRGYRVESSNAGHRVLLRADGGGRGAHWLEWIAKPAASGTSLTLTSFYAARGLPGHLYWYLMTPLRKATFRGWFGSIESRAGNC